MKKVTVGMGILLLTLAGACQQVDEPLPTGPAVGAISASRGHFELSDLATGGGEFLGDGTTSKVRFLFIANGQAGGSLSNGWYNSQGSGFFIQSFTTSNGSVEFVGQVTCLSIDGVNHHARVGGKIVSNMSTDPAYKGGVFEPGHDIWFRVADNGHQASNPDLSTYVGFEGAIPTSAAYCALQSWTTSVLHPVVEGAIDINP